MDRKIKYERAEDCMQKNEIKGIHLFVATLTFSWKSRPFEIEYLENADNSQKSTETA